MMIDKNKIIVLGDGFLGKTFRKEGFKILKKEVFYMNSNNYNLENLNKFEIIINCMGKSNTRWCEKSTNFEDAMFSNGIIPKILSEYCKVNNKKFIHISTGCLYDSNNIDNNENDFIVAHCNYTVTKWIGEKFCDPSVDLILRPRLYFGDFEDKNNLICKFPNFNYFLDELNSFTSVHVIVKALENLIVNNQSGIFNVACDGHETIGELSKRIGLIGKLIKEKDLHKNEGLFLVNNTMDISKLKKFYNPPNIIEEFDRCFFKIKGL